MTPDTAVLLDACVLIPMPLADTLLRMAETPRLYRPKWSDEILAEVSRNLLLKWNKTPEQVRRREDALRQSFPEALVEGYQSLEKAMTNHPKDRHILAAAVRSRSQLIVTYNQKDFPPESREPAGIKLQGPSTFLIGLHRQAPEIVERKLAEQADTVQLTASALLSRLEVNVPTFVAFLRSNALHERLR